MILQPSHLSAHSQVQRDTNLRGLVAAVTMGIAGLAVAACNSGSDDNGADGPRAQQTASPSASADRVGQKEDSIPPSQAPGEPPACPEAAETAYSFVMGYDQDISYTATVSGVDPSWAPVGGTIGASTTLYDPVDDVFRLSISATYYPDGLDSFRRAYENEEAFIRSNDSYELCQRGDAWSGAGSFDDFLVTCANDTSPIPGSAGFSATQVAKYLPNEGILLECGANVEEYAPLALVRQLQCVCESIG